MNIKQKLGSKTARGGFANEKVICRKFNNWGKDKEAQEWLQIMGYKIPNLEKVKAIQIPLRIKKEEIYKFNISEEE